LSPAAAASALPPPIEEPNVATRSASPIRSPATKAITAIAMNAHPSFTRLLDLFRCISPSDRRVAFVDPSRT